ncbi:MAG: sodium:proline symporter [Lutibacter sp.]|uniref:sensor histidine kinase n=1 Tax=Lutibacter sp. TaxID=1925666 RepID=UPI0017DE9D0B|nr:sensor histidine kinase [Lutibacter sp.]MBT8316089.1 sensor histidine kinase [Lutibacter sp.]NNJ56949.1 sodium:proline symporter [Lutibacter sp.]
MNSFLVIAIIIVYLSAIFYVAYWAEKNSKSMWVNNPYVYALSLAVYCTAWTYYGSVGLAATSGLKFLTIYLGPVIIIPVWILLMKKIIRISKGNKISSIADFISLRYGNDRFLGALVTVICVLAIVPYISLQLKAISETFNVITNHSLSENSIFNDTTFYIAILLALFAAFFGTQKTDASERHKGIVTAIALESIIKLIFFLVIGVYVTFYLFNGPTDIYNKASVLPNFETQQSIQGIEDGFNWFFLSMLSLFAIMLLPRQFQVTVVENQREKYLKTVTWLFPLYLLLFNIFVIFIAWGGNIIFQNQDVSPDLFTLLLPLKNNHEFLALLVFFGGFSAAISMVVISSLALSTMLSNNLIIPYGFLRKYSKRESKENIGSIKKIRRIAIFSLIILAYLFYRSFTLNRTLVTIGLISFVIIAQLAPSFFGGLFWRRGSSKGAKYGIIIGFLVTVYTLVIPFTIDSQLIASSFINEGVFGIKFLKPYELFGLQIFEPVPQAFFWSIFFNLMVYVLVSVNKIGSYRERNFAEMFVDSNKYASLNEDAYVWKGEAYVSDIRKVLTRFLGEQRTERALNLFYLKYNIDNNVQIADARLVNFSEKLLTGSIGSASSRILISSVVKEEEISLKEVLNILDETQKATESNKQLQERDKQKDEFLDTVAHELKTPITSIRALSEILLEDESIESGVRNKFLSSILSESKRVNRLINNILDLEKLASGRGELILKTNSIKKTIKKSINAVNQLALSKNVEINSKEITDLKLIYDEDRIQQVLINLLSNAIKFSDVNKGEVFVSTTIYQNNIQISVEDNGRGIAKDELGAIFKKFYQAKNQTILKPLGSGLGLAISKQIIESHNGKIWAANRNPQGAQLVFILPINLN